MGQMDLNITTAALESAANDCRSIASEVASVGSSLAKSVSTAKEGLICSGTEAFEEAIDKLVGNIAVISQDLNQISAGLDGVVAKANADHDQIITF